jgi:hypothetical protein
LDRLRHHRQQARFQGHDEENVQKIQRDGELHHGSCSSRTPDSRKGQHIAYSGTTNDAQAAVGTSQRAHGVSSLGMLPSSIEAAQLVLRGPGRRQQLQKTPQLPWYEGNAGAHPVDMPLRGGMLAQNDPSLDWRTMGHRQTGSVPRHCVMSALAVGPSQPAHHECQASIPARLGGQFSVTSPFCRLQEAWSAG